MKRKALYIGLLILSCFFSVKTNAQTVTVAASARTVRVTNPDNTTTDKIYIRIAPDGDSSQTAAGYVVNAWQRYKTSGYKIERFRVSNNTLESTVTITPNATSLLQKANDTLTINGDVRKKVIADASRKIYQALYQPTDPNIVQALATTASVNAYPYTLTMYGADLSFEAARLAGLGYIDETATNGVAYRYRITEVAAQQGTYTRFVDVNITKTFTALPAIAAPIGVFNRTYVNLKWRYNNPVFAQNYSSYWIQRAIGAAGAFTFQNQTPFIPSENAGIATDTTNYFDKLPNTKVLLRYKLIARTIFDEEVVSPEMSGMCIDDNIYVPKITKSDLFGTNVTLAWKYPSDTLLTSKSDYVNGFKIYTALLDSSTLYQPIPINGSVNNLLLPNDTTYVIPNITTTTFIKVVAINKLDGQLLYSGSVLVEPIDSTVNKPTNVSAVFNAAGKVNITWTAPSDNDIIGYKIFRKNTLDPNEEPSVITDAYINGLSYLDNMLKDTTVFTKDSTKYSLSNRNYVYYVAAIDGHFNQSQYSLPAIAKKPDDIRPTQPIITNYTITGNSVSLEYRKSFDEDIQNHKILRFELPAKIEQIILIDSQRDSTAHTTNDDTPEFNKTYAYVIIARDSSGNETMSNLVTIQITKNLKRPVIPNFKASVDSLFTKTVLTWDYQTYPDFQEFELFRTEDTTSINSLQTKPGLWKLATSSERTSIDTEVTRGKKIQYLIRAAFTDGTISDYSSVVISIPKANSTCTALAWIFLNAFLKPTTPQLIEACEQVVLEEGFGAEASDTGTVEIRTKQ